MMTSSNGNIFCVTSLCAGNSPVAGEFPSQKPVTRMCYVSLICAWINVWVNNREVGDLRRHCAHYHVTVIFPVTLRALGAILWEVTRQRVQLIRCDALCNTIYRIHHALGFVVSLFVWGWIYQSFLVGSSDLIFPQFTRFTSQALGQSCDCPSVCVLNLVDMSKSTCTTPHLSTQHSNSVHNKWDVLCSMRPRLQCSWAAVWPTKRLVWRSLNSYGSRQHRIWEIPIKNVFHR